MELKTEIRGLNELRSALRKIDSELPKELKRGFQKIAARVVSKAAPKVPSISGRARGSMTARGDGKIAVGGSKAPHYPWLDFGGRAGPNKRIVRDFIKQGRYLYPTIREEGDNIKSETDEVLERLIKAAGFETH